MMLLTMIRRGWERTRQTDGFECIYKFFITLCNMFVDLD